MEDLNPPDNESFGKEKLGAYLRKARLDLGFELMDLSRETKISIDFLKCMENGEYKSLPGDAYVRAYIRSLAKKYYLDADKILNWYLEETKQLPKTPETEMYSHESTLESPEPQKTYSPKFWLILGSVFIIILILIINTFQKNRAASAVQDTVSYQEQAPEPPPAPAPAAPALVAAAPAVDSAAKTDSVKKDTVAKDTAAKPATPAPTAAPAPTPAPAPAPAPAAPAVAPAAAPAPGAEAPTQNLDGKSFSILRVTCIKDSSWIQVTRSGKQVWGALLKKDQRPKTLIEPDTLTVRLASLDKFEISLNQKIIYPRTLEFKVYGGRIVK